MNNNNNKNIGVLTEQGYVAGSGLGFNPVKESELNPSKKKEKDKNTSNKDKK